MAVVEVRPIAEGRNGGDRVEKGPNGVPIVTREFTVPFLVITDDPEDGWDTIKSSLPALSSRYQSGNDYDDTAKCIGRSGDQRTDDRKIWDCEVEYSTESPSPNDTEGESEEVERELRQSIRWGTATMTRLLTRDIDGNPILNAAGDPFDQTDDVLIDTVSITRYERQATFAAFDLRQYNNSVNIDAFILDGRLIQPRWALFAGREASDTIVGSSQAKQVTYVIMIWPTTDDEELAAAVNGQPDFSRWDLELLEHGPNYIDANGVKQRVNRGGFGVNANLDATTGNKLADDAEPQYSYFRTRKRQPFAPLGFRQ